MRVVLQRVSEARVEVDGLVVGSIGRGLLVLVGIAHTDTEEDAGSMAEKMVTLRVFPDEEGKMNRSLLDVGGAVLAVSQFTLLANARKGRRPSYDEAARPEQARHLYEYFLKRCRGFGVQTEMGRFQAHMAVHLVNDGPVTLVLDSKKMPQ